MPAERVRDGAALARGPTIVGGDLASLPRPQRAASGEPNQAAAGEQADYLA